MVPSLYWKAPRFRAGLLILDLTRTAHLHSFFLAHNVGPLSRTRPGLTAGRRRLQVGDVLIYQGRVVALVKKVVSSYADGLGGVSERAFAVVR